MIRRRRFAIALFAFLLTSSLSFCAEQWSQIRSPNFDIITDAGEKRGREAALRFEQIRGAFAVVFQNAAPATPVPLQIVAFHSNRELRHFSPLWNGKPIEVAGLYVPGEDRQFILVDISSEDGWRVVFHEYTHLLLHSHVRDIPVWFDEGLAEYFSSLRVDKGVVHFGDVLPDRAYVLNNMRWMKIEYLFSIQQNSPEYNESGNHRSVLYAESWLVVHFLESNQRMKQVAQYLDLTEGQHVPVAEAIQRAFGMTPAQFDKALEEYYRGRATTFHIALPQLPLADSYTSRSISETDTEAILADLHLHEPDYAAQAVTEFQQVLEKQPNNAIAHRGLGYALLRKGEYAKAEEHLRTAIASGAADARTHYLYALLLTRKGFGLTQGTVMISATAEIDVAELKKEAQAAIALDPSFADAYNLLAYAQAREQDFQGAVASETRAFQLDQHKDVYILNLAQYQAQTHNLDQAERLLKALMNSHDPVVVANAQNYLQMVQTQRNFEAAHRAQASGPPPMQSFQPDTGGDSDTKTLAPEPPGSIQFLKGKIVKVDCSNAPAATVGVVVGKKLWAMTTPDRNKLILIGVESFSCDWQNRTAAMNFHPTAENAGQLVSLELQ